MTSHEDVSELETVKSVEESDQTDELSGETLGLVKESGEAEDEEKKRRFKCHVCGMEYDKFQALGGHMNKHPEEKNHLRIQQYERIRQKIDAKSFKTVNTREHTLETSSYPFNNIFQQPQQQVEHFQAQQTPQQLIWSQAPINEFNFAGRSANYVTTSNPSPTYVPSDAAVADYYGPASMDPSMFRLTSEQFNNLPTPRSMSTDNLYGYSAPPTHYVPGSMSSNSMYDYSFPCTRQCCNPLNLEPYQNPEVNIEQGQGLPSTLDWDRSSSLMLPITQMNKSSYVSYEDGLHPSEVGAQETATAQDTEQISNPSDAYTYDSFHH